MPFDCSEYPGNRGLVSYLDSGGEKPPLHFYHANGFPVSVYFPLLTELATDFRVLGLTMGGQDGLSEGISSWQGPADDLNGFLSWLETGPVIGVGHSIGAVSTLFATIKRPELFSGIVLLDPVLLPGKIVLLTRLLRYAGQKDRYPLAVRARKRRNGWATRQEALEYFRGKSLFQGWDNRFLETYATYGLVPAPDGAVTLLCPPEAEARGFESYPTDIWKWPSRLKVPALIVRGEESDALNENSYKKFLKMCPSAQGTVMKDAGHLLPMQQPAETVRLIKQFSLASQGNWFGG